MKTKEQRRLELIEESNFGCENEEEFRKRKECIENKLREEGYDD